MLFSRLCLIVLYYALVHILSAMQFFFYREQVDGKNILQLSPLEIQQVTPFSARIAFISTVLAVILFH